MTGDSTSRSARGLYGISVAAELSGIGPQTLRHYEKWGLLSPSRTDGGTRRYSDDDLERLNRISELVEQGVNLAGVGRILDLECRNTQLEANNTQLQSDNAKLKADRGRPARKPKQAKGVSIMANVAGGGPQDEVPEADAADQQRAVDFDDEAGLDTTYLSDGAADRDANEADLVDQAIVVPVADDDRETDR
ncbi:hypothetical protein B8W66_01790 [Mycobacterium decipiens]|uniref:HTH merR-type domain-containing protein n=2 Tax=Mycobacterium decipiens TaxID=1430326 RepID=A0A1X2M0U0_9MYCO|nr:hypothetical protein B8W66_01790 [Mycobacterium decipiens]